MLINDIKKTRHFYVTKNQQDLNTINYPYQLFSLFFFHDVSSKEVQLPPRVLVI